MPRTVCIYGDPDAAKSTQFYFIAKWLMEKYQLKSRYISFDGKYENLKLGSPSLIDAGIVDVQDFSKSKTALSDVRKLSEGYWPRKDKKTGERLLKATDQFMTNWGDARIGAYFIDHLSALSDLWLVHISDQNAEFGDSRAVGFKPAWRYEEEGYSYSGLQDGHYGMIQKELMRVVKQGFNTLPVKYVFYAAHVEKGTENYRRKRAKRNDPNAPAEINVTTMYGPKVAGQALTSFLPGWFADCFHLTNETVRLKGAETDSIIKVAYYETHEHSETTVPYKCRVDLLPEQIPMLREKFPGGFIPLGFTKGLDKFYNWVAEQNERPKEMTSAE
jgi:hypothetical protein